MLATPLAFYIYAKSNSECEEPSRSGKIRGNYENKIRFFSPPEKIFETFATIKQEDGQLAMSYSDFFRSLTPYNYTENKDMSDYFEKNDVQALKVADVNGDGVIDFTEFFFFITIIQLPESIIRKVFAEHGSNPNSICKADLHKVLADLRKNTILGQKQKNTTKFDARLIKASEQDFLATNKAICEHMLRGKEEITLAEFLDFRESLKTALRHYEFFNYDVEHCTISCEDFAKSLLTCLPISTSQTYVKHIHSVKLEGRVTFEEFIAF